MQMLSNPVLPNEMATWIEHATGASIVDATRHAGGGRNEAWIVCVRRADDSEYRVFFRWDRSDPAITGDPWTLRREAGVYRALSSTALPVARFIALHPDAQAMLLTVVEGDARFALVDDAQRATRIAQDFMRHLAELHRLDVASLGLADPTRPTVRDHVTAQLDEIEALLRFRGGVPETALGVALTWLRGNVPDYDGPAVLVQGDTGPGNFMFIDDRVSAIVDWELAHLGDPMDDLAWVSLRAVQEPFTDLGERFADYAHLSGNAIDLERIRYYRVLAEAKIIAMSHGRDAHGAGDPDGAGDPGARLVFGHLHRRLLVETLLEAMGLAPDPVEPIEADEPGEWHRYYGVVLDQLRTTVSPRIADGFALQRTKGLARAIKYLEAADRLGRGCASAELLDLTDVLGRRPDDVADGRRQLAIAVRDGTVDPAGALRVAQRRVCRDNELLRQASGALADRHYDALARFSSGR